MRKLIADIYSGEVDLVIVTDFARLTRNPLYIQKLLNLFNDYGVELIAVNDGYGMPISQMQLFGKIEKPLVG
jgi:DNA invertase Pin-like site-specific DNA recombinase